MRLTRVTLLCLALIIGLGFYRLIVYILEDVEAQTFQATVVVLVDVSHFMTGMNKRQLKDGELNQQSLSGTFAQ